MCKVNFQTPGPETLHDLVPCSSTIIPAPQLDYCYILNIVFILFFYSKRSYHPEKALTQWKNS